MVSSRIGSLVFVEVSPTEGWVNVPKLIRWHFIVQTQNKQKASKDLLKGSKRHLQWSRQSPALSSTVHAFHLLKAERLTSKQQRKVAVVKDW